MKLKKLIFKIIDLSACSVMLFNTCSFCNDELKANAANSQIEKALEWAVSIANDNSHGYSQANRQGPDYDCSSLVVNALKKAGLNTGNASYTGNMKSELTKCGFTWIEWSQINNVSNLQRGDILLHRTSSGGHTEFYLGNNQNVGAHSDRGYPQTGDQTGTEISVCSYWYDNWNGVLRYSAGPIPEIKPTPADGCFQACGSGYTSIVEALKSIGVDSSYSYRAKIAAANGISGYSGSASQNTQMLNLLKAGTLKVPGNDPVPEPPPIVDYGETYFPACSSSFTSLVDALKSIGVDSSMSYRKTIAEKNGISGYSGSASQNTQMLNLLKSGKLLNPSGTTSAPDTSGKYFPACSSGASSIVDALKSIGVDSSMSYRKSIAEKNGISGYSGSASQNTQMLNLLKSGTLIKPEYTEPPAIVNYTVSLNANGGSTPIDSMSIASNSTYNGLPTPSREGYSFAGWYTDANGGSQVSDGNALVSNSNHTLYAHWNANKYTVSFDQNDGSGITSSKTIVFGNTYGELASPSRTGYTLAGWYTDISEGTKVNSDSIFNIADNLTLYAHWSANKYTVSFDLNGGTGNIADKSVTYGNEYGTIEEPVRDGYTFTGWFTEATGGTRILPETLISNASNHVIYAQWTKNPEKTPLKVQTSSVALVNGEQFTIEANQENLTYKSNNPDVAVVSKKGIITAIGEGNAVISVINENSDVVQIKVNVTPASLPGDCNNDGAVSIADAVELQQWLLGSGNLTKWQNADLCKDNVINVFDMISLKRLLIKNK